jgi:hypothetical protein
MGSCLDRQNLETEKAQNDMVRPFLPGYTSHGLISAVSRFAGQAQGIWPVRTSC